MDKTDGEKEADVGVAPCLVPSLLRNPATLNIPSAASERMELLLVEGQDSKHGRLLERLL